MWIVMVQDIHIIQYITINTKDNPYDKYFDYSDLKFYNV